MTTHPVADEVGSALAALADRLEYPGADAEMDGGEGPDALAGCPPARAALDRFSTALLALPRERREELFTATFDVSPVCVPYVSIHLFGEENFKRGEFMAALNARYDATGFAVRDELPDHVRNLLRYAARAPMAERRDLAKFCLLGPLADMRRSLGAENPYAFLLDAALAVLAHAHPGLEAAPRPKETRAPQSAFCGTQPAGCSCAGLASHEAPGREASQAVTAPGTVAPPSPLTAVPAWTH